MTNLELLIENHRQAVAELSEAIDAYDKADADYYKEVKEPFTVPCFIGGFFSDELSRDEMKQLINERYNKAIVNMVFLDCVAPELGREAKKILEAKRIENIALADKIFADEANQRVVCGLNEAERVFNEASDAEEAAAMAICSYRCQSIEEYETRANYILSQKSLREFFGRSDYAIALLNADASMSEPNIKYSETLSCASH